MAASRETVAAVTGAVDARRLLDTAVALVAVPSPTRSAGAVADRLAELLAADGLPVERPVADWPEASAVVARLRGAGEGRVLQLEGHLDTVHLPFAPPAVADGVLRGSGAADMKGGIAAAVEAMRCLREVGLSAGGILLTAHDHHEGPWGDGRQAEALIRDGYVGDGVLVPEYLADRLPGAGRGMGIFALRLYRSGEPVHEVLRPVGLPDVIAAGAELVRELKALDARVGRVRHAVSGRDSVFVGQIEAGQIYNQAPVDCWVRGTRRWVTAGSAAAARAELDAVARQVATTFGVDVEVAFDAMGDAFEIAAADPLVDAFQAACGEASGARPPWGDKPFLDDGNRFIARGITAITHGPAATGAHTTSEAVAVAELVRVARVYALTALRFCGGA